MKPTTFDITHPAIAALYFLAVCCLCMATFHPAYLTIGFAGALAYNFYLRGARSTCKTLGWQMPLVLIITIANPIISPLGDTFLCAIGPCEIYLESLVRGACAGIMLVTVMLWFSNATHVITSDKLMFLTGRFAPTIGLMLSMIGRLVPLFVSRGNTISESANLNGAAQNTRSGRMRSMNVLLGWSMEDSLECAAAMSARGWGAARTRTSYARYRFYAFDGVVLGVLCALLVATCVFFIPESAAFYFYPTLAPVVFSAGWVIYALLVFAPLIAQGIERIRWRS